MAIDSTGTAQLVADPGMARRYEGGDLLVTALAERGVRHLFSVSGGPLNSIYHATLNSSVELVHTRHEAAAGFMADATARLTGVPGVCAVTLGPGVTNTATPLLTAQLGGIPMLVVGGQAPTSTFDRSAGMSFDPLPLVTPVTKWAARVLDTARIPEYIDAAWRTMLAGRPGPVFLEIPVDVLSGPAEPARLDRRHCQVTFGPAPTAAAIAHVQDLLRNAARPLIIAGDDVHWTGAGTLLQHFVEHTGLPFVLARLARGAVAENHPLCAGVAYLPANETLRRALRETDLILLLGYTFDFDLGFGDTVPRGVTVIQVHPDASQIARNLVPDVAVVARSDDFLHGLLASGIAPGRRDRTWAEGSAHRWRREREALLAASRGGEVPMHPLRLVEEVQKAAPPDTIFVASHGNIDFWADQALQVARPDTYLRAGQSGSLGAEVPYGVAAKLAHPQRPVVVFVGDGGFAFHGLELDTAARYGAPIVVVVADDQKWGAIALPQQRAYGVQVGMDLPQRDWAEVAIAVGGRGEYVSEREGVGPALRRLLAAGAPGVLQVPVQSVESPYMRSISGG